MDGLGDLAPARAFLAAATDPAVALQTARLGGRPPDEPAMRGLRARLYADRRINRVFDRQAADGSWGDAPSVGRRILPTLWLAKILAELGVAADHAGLARALTFLADHAIVDGGVSANGRRDGVLSCYTGILADTLLRAGLPEVAAGPLRWIATYQHVRYGGHDYLGARPVWGAYLATRYGGCLAGTTCLLGVVKCGMALVRAHDQGCADSDALDVLAAVRSLLCDRELFRRRDGGVIPLGVSPRVSGAAAERWLTPAFPLTYQTDLLELAQLAAQVGVPAARMAPAVERIASWRLPDGTWPMARRCSASTWYQPERPARDTGSLWITLRVVRLSERLPPPA